MGQRAFRFTSFLLFAALAILHTWPLATDPGTLSRNDNADTVLNQWILAWIAHQLPRNPLGLFDANIFHPELRTLAYSENLIVPGLIAAPLLWLGASPVLAHNLVMIAGFALTGWAMSLVVERWTGDRWAGVLAGCLMAFNAHTLTRMAHLQAHYFAFLPLALLALDRLLSDPRPRHALAAAGWFTLQALSSLYLVVFTAIALAVSTLARPGDWLGPRRRALAPQALLSGLAAGVLTAPFLLQYYLVREEQGLSRTLAEVAQFSAQPGEWLATGGRIHFELWSQPFFQGNALFPGVTALALVGVALASGVGFRDARARMCLAFGVLAFFLSFGPAFPLYGMLHETFPLMKGIRAAARFGHLGLAAVAVLAGFGFAWLRLRWTGRRGLAAASAALVVLANGEALRVPMGYVAWDGIPRVYDLLAAEDVGVVAEFPFFETRAFFRNADYMLASTRHWKPLLNGYSGFVPESYARRVEALRGFPDDRSLAELSAAGVTHVVVHTNLLPGLSEGIDRSDALAPVFVGGPVHVYRLVAGGR